MSESTQSPAMSFVAERLFAHQRRIAAAGRLHESKPPSVTATSPKEMRLPDTLPLGYSSLPGPDGAHQGLLKTSGVTAIRASFWPKRAI